MRRQTVKAPNPTNPKASSGNAATGSAARLPMSGNACSSPQNDSSKHGLIRMMSATLTGDRRWVTHDSRCALNRSSPNEARKSCVNRFRAVAGLCPRAGRWRMELILRRQRRMLADGENNREGVHEEPVCGAGDFSCSSRLDRGVVQRSDFFALPIFKSLRHLSLKQLQQ